EQRRSGSLVRGFFVRLDHAGMCHSWQHCTGPKPSSTDDEPRRNSMIRLVPLIVAAMQFVGSLAAWAQTTAPEDGPRYTLHPPHPGYLRLDGRTGQVSVCTQRPPGWACQPVPDERAALEAEIARLQAENAAVKKELVAHNLPLPGTVKPEPPASKPEEP